MRPSDLFAAQTTGNVSDKLISHSIASDKFLK